MLVKNKKDSGSWINVVFTAIENSYFLLVLSLYDYVVDQL